MASTVVMEKDGLLVNSKGVNGESGRMKKLASRMLGGTSSKAILNYGWNGAGELEISKGGQKGEKLIFNAATTVVTGDLRVGNESIFDLLDQASAAALAGIDGVPGEIKVYSDSSDEVFMIGLDPEFLRRIDEMDSEIDDLIVASRGYSIGDGLSLSDPGNTLSVNIGQGLKFQSAPNQSGRQVVLDMDQAPSPGSQKPVTSDGVYRAITGGGVFVGSVCGIGPDQSGNVQLDAGDVGAATVDDIPTALSQLSDDATHRTVTDAEKVAWNAKQNALTFDSTPTAGSANPVKSGGVKSALDGKLDMSGGTITGTLNIGENVLSFSGSGDVIEQYAESNGSGVVFNRNGGGARIVLPLLSETGIVALTSDLPYSLATPSSGTPTANTRQLLKITATASTTEVTANLPAIPTTDEVLNCDIVVDGKAATEDFGLVLGVMSSEESTHPVHCPDGEAITCKAGYVTMVSCVGIFGIGWLVVGCNNLKTVST